MTSSLRTVPLDVTLSRAQRLAVELGISRVTDTTWLDYIGIPVFSSIRPDATPGSLCVNAGKGVRPAEARVGAYMEAIEFAVAEYRRRNVDVFLSTPRAVVEQPAAGFDFLSLCPILGRPVDPDGPLACVHAEDVVTGDRVALPAELAFSPFAENPGQRIFGTSTNGLASGNSVDEATVHGLAEVLERDVSAFNYFDDTSRFVTFDDPAGDLDELRTKIEAAGLEAVLRYTENAFGLPYFHGFILEPTDDAPIAISHGSGLHPVRDIAAVRALSEAAQSRLSYIHGGRDDLIDRFAYFAAFDGELERQATAQLRANAGDRANPVRYADIPRGPAFADIPAALDFLLGKLREQGLTQVLRVVLSKPDSPLAVVKVVVPGLESFEPLLKRIGPRLAAKLDAREVSHV
ncbi:YcaO-like family protein [Lentzea sp. NBC_00516]|uniref:YcaO-like family protein n=1 Tax=Lentzea sp. NBC_00516 TaxID=2903582 RepID=UPI002E819CDD|nr:YcaO-like family protein [Lentzea sp. NBC_00516]WUD27447.1 YcaO-like family protein [Lentzea sp. NBC_00516]